MKWMKPQNNRKRIHFIPLLKLSIRRTNLGVIKDLKKQSLHLHWHFFPYKYKHTCFKNNNVWLQFLLLFYMVILLLKKAHIHLCWLLITVWSLLLWGMSHWKNTSHVFISLHHLLQQGRKSHAEAGHFLHCAGNKQIKYEASEFFINEEVTFL